MFGFSASKGDGGFTRLMPEQTTSQLLGDHIGVFFTSDCRSQ